MGAQIRVYDDLDTLSAAAADLFASLAHAAMREHGRFAVALAGGSTPKRAYELLAKEPLRERVQWDKVHIFFGDERCVRPSDSRSNYGMAREALLRFAPIARRQIHPILCGRDPEKAAREYETVLRGFFDDEPYAFDLMLLGMGEDGHTASLFPGTNTVTEQERWAVEVCPPSQELCRVTLTAPILNRSRTVAFLVSGASKAATLREVLEGPQEPERFPAQLIQPAVGELLWLLDRGAASMLTSS